MNAAHLSVRMARMADNGRLRADRYFATGAVDACIAHCDKVLDVTKRQGPDANHCLTVLGRALRRKGMLRESLSVLLEASAKSPIAVDVCKDVVRAYLLLGDSVQALARLDRCSELLALLQGPAHDDDYELLLLRAKCLAAAGREDDVLRLYLDSLRARPTEEAFAAALEIHRASLSTGSHLEAGASGAAIALATQAISTFPESPALLTAAARLYAMRGDPYRAAELLCVSAAFDAHDPGTLLAAAALQQATGDREGALAKYRVADALAPGNASLWAGVGEALLAGPSPSRVDLQRGRACLQRALSLDPLHWRASLALGRAHARDGQLASAAHRLGAAAAYATRDAPEPHHALGAALLQLGDAPAAVGAYAAAVAAAGESSLTGAKGVAEYCGPHIVAARERLQLLQKSESGTNGGTGEGAITAELNACDAALASLCGTEEAAARAAAEAADATRSTLTPRLPLAKMLPLRG